jgi:hypothetical protein
MIRNLPGILLTMVSLMPSLFLLLLAFIMVNSSPPISQQASFFDPFRKGKQGPSKIKSFNRFLQARAPQILTPKEDVLDMPISTNYGSTGRPPGKYLRDVTPRKKLSRIFQNFRILLFISFPLKPIVIVIITLFVTEMMIPLKTRTIVKVLHMVPAATASVPMLNLKLLTTGP